MNIYLISQTVNDEYDTYDSAVVCAESEESAQTIHPYSKQSPSDDYGDWCDPADVTVKYLGIATPHLPKGVICSSFNAG